MTQGLEPCSKIEIKAVTHWLANHKANSQGKYAFSYQRTIVNHNPETVQLINRYWLITDGNGKQTEVAGRGVVGETPVLDQGERFTYTSGAILDTPIGFMQGHYEFSLGKPAIRDVTDNTSPRFKAPIDVFTLSVPNTVN